MIGITIIDVACKTNEISRSLIVTYKGDDYYFSNQLKMVDS